MTDTSKKDIDFTPSSNDEVDSFTHGDTMVQFTGSVAWIDGMKLLKSKKRIFRFVMTNGTGRRIRFLVWDPLISEYQAKLHEKLVVKFERLKCQNADPNFAQAAEDVAPIELTITGSTTKDYDDSTSVGPRVYEPISIPRVYEEFGVQGFIRDLFEDITFNNNVYGAGSITDGEYRVKVQVRSFSKARDSLKKHTLGVHVEVKGQVNRDKTSAFPYVQCNSMSDVKIVDDKMMSAADVKKGFRTPTNPSPKRIRIEPSTIEEINGPSNSRRVIREEKGHRIRKKNGYL
ncbi:uncharacterized protein LOC123270402 isoform X2 [Cotesia glomerata]|uniref:uncharacterized protein LOC123270402 isoform X2 n=1 Tax=Cotesia glomerata TaxID=32391 RepID=UPI001D0034DD|nr:uncharacterized protein LOC123270402 isoform X2 [Cotesia glomerata]